MTKHSTVYYARKKARFYRFFFTRMIVAGVVILILTIINVITNPDKLWVLWVTFGFTTLFILTYLKHVVSNNLFNKNWEKRFIEKNIKKHGDE